MYRQLTLCERQGLAHGATNQLVNTPVIPLIGYPGYDPSLYANRTGALPSQADKVIININVSDNISC